jgi:hypothetical protein
MKVDNRPRDPMPFKKKPKQSREPKAEKNLLNKLVLSLGLLLTIYFGFKHIKVPVIDTELPYMNQLIAVKKQLSACEYELKELQTTHQKSRILKNLTDKEGQLLGYQVGKGFGKGNRMPVAPLTKSQEEALKKLVNKKQQELKECRKNVKNFEKDTLEKIKKVYNRIQELKKTI